MERKQRFREDYLNDAAEEDTEDDGRTIADMSQVSRDSLLGTWHQKQADAPGEAFRGPDKEEHPWENSSFSRKEQWMYALGALKAALLIGLVYLGGLGLLIALLLLFW
ncbi:MAG: hypothetical protein Q4E89_01970 [Eubacteriales bacterium]|nr:hypothetical protein [Eubacteriales bacterium]